MSLDSQILQRRPNIWSRQLFLLPTAGMAVELVPRLFFEAKIDFTDVRSGLRETCSISRAMEMHPIEGDSVWTDDMSCSIDASKLTSDAPESIRLSTLPDYVTDEFLGHAETGFLTYLLRYFKIRIYRNFTLNTYSRAGESLPDFEQRCAELLQTDFRREVDLLHEVFGRKLEQIKQKFSSRGLREEGDPIVAGQNSLFHRTAERLTALFLRIDIGSEYPPLEPVREARGPDLQEKLRSVEYEAGRELGRLVNSYREKIRSNDEYIVHVNARNIHIVRACILWVPSET